MLRKPNSRFALEHRYIVTRLKESGGNLELCVLSRLIEEMAGIESFQDTTNKALSGGRVLKRTSSVIERIAHSKKSRKASQKLQDVIVRDEAFALPFLILMAQQKYVHYLVTHSSPGINSHQ